eukprot:TRINITY_DN1898_c0_g1_i1.p1 TRINITY_DN1898_c0_g1~~TRINITY_DN1898_c0_g1_i1.p1  ORF type:complete len:585 (+),score=100.28 TRINITY_DN1898_c0_g1_i1:309-2063(+)
MPPRDHYQLLFAEESEMKIDELPDGSRQPQPPLCDPECSPPPPCRLSQTPSVSETTSDSVSDASPLPLPTSSQRGRPPLVMGASSGASQNPAGQGFSSQAASLYRGMKKECLCTVPHGKFFTMQQLVVTTFLLGMLLLDIWVLSKEVGSGRNNAAAVAAQALCQAGNFTLNSTGVSQHMDPRAPQILESRCDALEDVVRHLKKDLEKKLEAVIAHQDTAGKPIIVCGGPSLTGRDPTAHERHLLSHLEIKSDGSQDEAKSSKKPDPPRLHKRGAQGKGAGFKIPYLCDEGIFKGLHIFFGSLEQLWRRGSAIVQGKKREPKLMAEETEPTSAARSSESVPIPQPKERWAGAREGTGSEFEGKAPFGAGGDSAKVGEGSPSSLGIEQETNQEMKVGDSLSDAAIVNHKLAKLEVAEKRLKDQEKKLKGENAKLKAENAKLKAKEKDLKRQLQKLTAEKADAATKQKESLEPVNQEESAHVRIPDLERELEAQRESLRKLEEKDRESTVKLAAKQVEFTDFLVKVLSQFEKMAGDVEILQKSNAQSKKEVRDLEDRLFFSEERFWRERAECRSTGGDGEGRADEES